MLPLLTAAMALTYGPLPNSGIFFRTWPTLAASEPAQVQDEQVQKPHACGSGPTCKNCQTCPMRTSSLGQPRSGPVSMMAGIEELAAADGDAVAAATAASNAAAKAAEIFGVKGGNGGDLHGPDGVEPVIKAALEAAASSTSVVQALEKAGRAAASRTNANAARVADAIIVAAKGYGAQPVIATSPITGAERYGTLQVFSAAKWVPEEVE